MQTLAKLLENAVSAIETRPLDAITKTVPQELQPLELALKEKKIGQLGNDESPLRQTLLLIYSMVGLRPENYPKGLDKDLLYAFIRDNYQNFTCAEIRLAFTIALRGETAAEVRHFEYFSILYLSGIMNAYRAWANERIAQLPAPPVIQKLVPKEILDLEIKLSNAYSYLKTINRKPLLLKLK